MTSEQTMQQFIEITLTGRVPIDIMEAANETLKRIKCNDEAILKTQAILTAQVEELSSKFAVEAE